jgi:ribose transport system ATP-binding protein
LPDIRALADASLDVRAGEIHALVGENGVQALVTHPHGHALAPDSGEITFGGHRVTTFSPLEARRLGIVAIHQHPSLFLI